MRKLFVLSAFLATAISAFVVFQTMQAIQYDYPLGTDDSFELLVSESTVPKDQLIDGLIQAVDERGGCLVKPSTSAGAYGSRRDLIYFSSIQPSSSSPVIGSDGSISWLTPGMGGKLLSARTMGDSPLAGTYMLKSDQSLHEALDQWANENGVTIIWYGQKPLRDEVLSIVVSGGMIIPWLSTQLLVLTLAMTWIILRLHTRAIQLLGGITSAQIHRETLGILARLLAIGGTLGIALSGILVTVVLGPANVLLVLPPTAILCLLSFACLLVLIYLLSVIVGTGMESLRLRRPVVGKILPLCRTISAVALILSMQTIPPAISLAQRAWKSYTQSSIARCFGDTIAVSLNNFDYLDTEEGAQEAQRVMHDLSQKGCIVTSLVIDSEIEISNDVRGGYSQFVIVDPSYLHLIGITLPTESGESVLTEVSFDSLPSATKDFLQGVLSVWMEGEMTFKETFSFYEYHGDGLIALGQNASYNSAFTTCKNPLVIVMNVPVDKMSMTGFVMPLISTGNIMFTDPESTKEAFAASPVYPYIASFDRVADVTLTTGQDLLANALLYLAITSISLLSICACALQCASSWAIAHEEEVFLAHTAGIGYRSIYAPRMRSDLAFSIMPLVIGAGICIFVSPYSTPLVVMLGTIIVETCFALFSTLTYTIACRKTFTAHILRKG